MTKNSPRLKEISTELKNINIKVCSIYDVIMM